MGRIRWRGSPVVLARMKTTTDRMASATSDWSSRARTKRTTGATYLGGGLRPPSEPPPKDSLRRRSRRSERNKLGGGLRPPSEPPPKDSLRRRSRRSERNKLGGGLRPPSEPPPKDSLRRRSRRSKRNKLGGGLRPPSEPPPKDSLRRRSRRSERNKLGGGLRPPSEPPPKDSLRRRSRRSERNKLGGGLRPPSEPPPKDSLRRRSRRSERNVHRSRYFLRPCGVYSDRLLAHIILRGQSGWSISGKMSVGVVTTQLECALLARGQLVEEQVVHDRARVPLAELLGGRVGRVEVDDRHAVVLAPEPREDVAHQGVDLLLVGLPHHLGDHAIDLGVVHGVIGLRGLVRQLLEQRVGADPVAVGA